MGKYKDFVDSISTNVDSYILDLENEKLLKLAMSRLAAASIHKQPNTMYHAAVLIYVLLDNNDALEYSGFIDPEEVDWLYILGMMGDVIMSYVEDKRDAEDFPFWVDHATNLLSIILGHDDFQIGEFRYNSFLSKSITTP